MGRDLTAQIANRPGLQRAATVPLILAFYCIAGGEEPLPDFRRDLYAMVIRSLLTEAWRHSYNDDREPDVDACLETLQAWAVAGATTNPVSGVGTWADEIGTQRVRLGEVERNAIDHIAWPLGPARLQTGTTQRRFIHRSIRDHLVGEYVAVFRGSGGRGAAPPSLVRP